MARIDHAVTSGTFSLDGQTFDVDNNIWVIGDDAECVVIDAPHSVADIVNVVGDRTVRAVLCTHAHDDHVRVAPELGRTVEAPVLLHPADLPVWQLTHDDPPDGELVDGQQIPVADIALQVIHTPGHAPGAVCFYSPQLGVVFTGDTLFSGGPGATGRSFSNFDVIVHSIAERLLTSPRRPWRKLAMATTPPSPLNARISWPVDASPDQGPDTGFAANAGVLQRGRSRGQMVE